ncbi:MAG: MBL fold metallo-hydrolase [Gammaproteobacteria bacterium]|nr:MBL fold metallo-hydrolase [Gammaproteobacteria bacterium]
MRVDSPGRGAKRWLADTVGLRVLYTDETVFGAAISGRCEADLHRRLAVLHDYRAKLGLQQLVTEAVAVLGRVLPHALAELRAGPERLRETWLHPRPDHVRPAYLRVEANVSDVVCQIPLAPGLIGELAAWLGAWQEGATPPAAGPARAVWDALEVCGALVATPPARAVPEPPGVRFIGHATLGVSDGAQRIVFDPFLVPRSTRYPAHWQPATPASLGRPDAVFVTHSHPDHFDTGTLLRWGPDVPVYVPAVGRESVLAIDMAARLHELGFRRVHAVGPWEHVTIGELHVETLPFFGEQPTTREVLHPEVRNVGLTYAVTYRDRRIGVFADSGRDHAGDVLNMVGAARARGTAFDTVIGGYRGFAVYPVQFLFSSVSRYLPFVPPSLWGTRQQIMCDADGLVDLAERAGARRAVPYADGGAPWFWLRGLGPDLDSQSPAAMATDPPPSHVADVARRRAHTLADGPLASPVEIAVPGVGDQLAF